MILVEKHIIRKGNKIFLAVDDICFRAKNIYNLGLYLIRQEFISNGGYVTYNKLDKLMSKDYSDCYKSLPSVVAQQTLMLLDKNFKSFFTLNKKFKEKPTSLNGKPKIPKYKDKLKGRFIATYNYRAISKKAFVKEGVIKLTGSDFKIKTKVKNLEDIKQVRIVPKDDFYVIEVVYEFVEKEIIEDVCLIASIDLGINNLATVAFSDLKDPVIISGKPLKSINQYYNKKKASIQSGLEVCNKKKISKRIKALTQKRNNKVNDYLHKASRLLVNHLVSQGVSNLVIGHNKNWKQEVNIGRKNNQNFVCIPHSRFIEMLEYKCQMVGIVTQRQEESYTSKCSFLDLEEVKKQVKYQGRRTKTKMFKSSTGKIINADLNGSFNIMRKAISGLFTDKKEIEGVVVHPKKLGFNS